MKKIKQERDVFGEDLRPDYSIKNSHIKYRITEVEIPLNHSAEFIEEMAKKDREALIRRERIFNEKPEYFNEIQRIDIDKINDELATWNLFEYPTKMEQIDLMRSIENVGLLNPIYVTVHDNGSYNVIIGRCRLLAYCNLWKKTNLDKYRFIPCYVIPFSQVDELYIRSMMIESNICFRKISKGNMVKALLENYEAMKRVKKYRNEKNLGMELSKQFQVSESTVFNYLKAKNLCNPAQTLLYDDEISLQVATYLTKVPKETQEKILELCGKEGVKAIFRLRLLTNNENITPEQLEKEIKRVNELLPQKTKITIEVSQALLNPLMQHLLDFKRNVAAEKASRMQGKFKDVFNVRFNEKDLSYYKGIIDETVLKKLLAKNLVAMSKIK
ncbi:MAG: ParB N-terminal domain-containing protein [Oscillospiraceae bacterium]|nr:ParB N-terminal domain-containing protein [Oscillospiraceae bacterium]